MSIDIYFYVGRNGMRQMRYALEATSNIIKNPRTYDKQTWNTITEYLLLYETANDWMTGFLFCESLQNWYSGVMTRRLVKKIDRVNRLIVMHNKNAKGK